MIMVFTALANRFGKRGRCPVSNRRPSAGAGWEPRRGVRTLGISSLLIAFPFYWMVISTIVREGSLHRRAEPASLEAVVRDVRKLWAIPSFPWRASS